WTGGGPRGSSATATATTSCVTRCSSRASSSSTTTTPRRATRLWPRPTCCACARGRSTSSTSRVQERQPQPATEVAATTAQRPPSRPPGCEISSYHTDLLHRTKKLPPLLRSGGG